MSSAQPRKLLSRQGLQGVGAVNAGPLAPRDPLALGLVANVVHNVVGVALRLALHIVHLLAQRKDLRLQSCELAVVARRAEAANLRHLVGGVQRVVGVEALDN